MYRFNLSHLWQQSCAVNTYSPTSVFTSCNMLYAPEGKNHSKLRFTPNERCAENGDTDRFLLWIAFIAPRGETTYTRHVKMRADCSYIS